MHKILYGKSTGLKVAAGRHTTTTKGFTTSSATTTARDTVMSTAELLDAILSFLPGRDILVRARRVCKNWKDAIDHSPTIQARLWLKSNTIQAIAPLTYSTNRPVLQTMGWHTSRVTSDQDPPIYPADTAPNSLRQFRSGYKCSTDGVWTIEDPGYLDPKFSPRLASKRMLINAQRWQAAFAAVKPSWLGMYLTEPRITVAQLDVQLRDENCRRLLPMYYTYSSVSVREADVWDGSGCGGEGSSIGSCGF